MFNFPVILFSIFLPEISRCRDIWFGMQLEGNQRIAPTRGEDFGVRLSYEKLRSKAAKRVKEFKTK